MDARVADPCLQTAAAAVPLAYAGAVSPEEAWALFSAGEAVIVDVRTAEERIFVGQVPGSIHVPWATGLVMVWNADFLVQLMAKVPRETAVLFLCRSAKRSGNPPGN